jgi:hypothetical protein
VAYYDVTQTKEGQIGSPVFHIEKTTIEFPNYWLVGVHLGFDASQGKKRGNCGLITEDTLKMLN